MAWFEVSLVEWTCDVCGRHVLQDEALPEGWQEDPITGDHWCGCAPTLAQHVEADARADLFVLDGETLADALGGVL